MDHKLPSRISADKYYFLENCAGSSGDLITINTSSKKKRFMKEEIRKNINHWMKNELFNNFRDKKLDMAIVLHVNKQKYEKQDVDNVVKVVFDALQKRNNKDENHYLFKDDAQIVRLLVYKVPRTEIDGSNTDYLQISFREHNPKKQMILTHKKTI